MLELCRLILFSAQQHTAYA